MKKKIILICFILLVILIVILIKLEYKGTISGNNIIKSDSDDILNISSYEADITVEVRSNKNTNKYRLKQKYFNPNTFSQEVIEPSNMNGLKIITDGQTVTLENSKMDLKTVYEDFNGDVSVLNLIGFINEYKKGAENVIEENETEKVIKIKINKNRYQMYQNLYISKDTNLPTKMEILDINKNTTVYILYNEIKINKTSKNDVLGV